MSETRQIAVEILNRIFNDQIFFNEAKIRSDADKRTDLPFVNMLVLTTLRRLVFIRKVLNRFIKKPHRGTLRFADCALYAAVAEMLFLDTPDYAVINSYIGLIKQRHDKYIANFANAVLRNIARSKAEILNEDASAFFPPEFIKILKKGYTPKQIKLIEEFSAREAPLDLTFKNPEETAAWNPKLNGTILPNGSIRLDNNGKIAALPGYDKGMWWIQDFAASLPVLAMGNVKGLRVLDLCAAPGGKTAQLISRGAQTTALDISAARLNTLSENLKRLSLQTEATVCADALDYLQNFSGKPFDALLLDAPCSASGTVRRHPELVHLKTLNDIKKAAELQKRLLSQAGRALKDGGILLYTVCSISPDEGEEQIKSFLAAHPEFRLLPIAERDIDLNGSGSLDILIDNNGFLRTLPYYCGNQGGMDAFFAAKLQKVKNA